MDILGTLVNVGTAIFGGGRPAAGAAQPSGVQLLMNIPGAADAINYVRKQLVKLQQVPARLSALDQGRLALQKVAQQKADARALGDLNAMPQSLQDLQGLYQTAANAVASALLGLNAAGFGFVPLELAGQVIGAAANMAQLFKRLDEREKYLAGIAGRLGVAPPTGTAPAGVGTAVKWGAGLGLGYFALRALGKSQGGRTW